MKAIKDMTRAERRAEARRVQKRFAVAPGRRQQAASELARIRRRDNARLWKWLLKFWDVVNEQMVLDPAGYGMQIMWALEEYRDAYGEGSDEHTAWLQSMTDRIMTAFGNVIPN